ncbi:hypothetical protein F4818DRAFT_441944 [Hypoxylon cercidicola]|nr:hypothetical protein F4818DRAFT_441944 [Hypoxylon cercidicola]
MLMVKLPSWDASPSGTTDLRRVGEELALATPQHIRIPYSCHDGLQTRFLILAKGDADWPSEDVRGQPVFVVFQYNTRGKELGFGANSIDPALRNGSLARSDCYDEALRRFPWFCREKRFVEDLDTTFFMCVDGDDVTKTGLLLVRRRWDGNVWGRSRDDLLGLPVDSVKDVRVPVKEALALLEKGRKGETDEMSESLREFFS